MLVKVDYLNLKNIDNDYKICSYNITLATYKSKERALEVLDEIQNLFKLEIRNETFERSDLLIKARMLPVIYQMPKD